MNKSILLKFRHAIGSCLLMCVLLSTPGFGQTINVSGTVQDENGQALPGVNIVIRGSVSGTITDSEGKFRIQASSSDVLVFSFVGYLSQEVTVAGQTTINLTLAGDVTALQEIVVTGYASEKKADLTGAVAVVKLDALTNNATGNPMQALQGRVAGLYIEKNGGAVNGENSRILIRGNNSLRNIGPLYVIDGVPTTRAEVFMSLPASSIESMQVLKDASAASIYGSRAANGVIIVTTKDGSSKKGDELSITFNTSVSMLNTKPQRVDMLSAEERGRVLWRGAVNDRSNPNANTNLYSYDWNNDFNNPILNKVNINPFLNGNPLVPAADTDWQEESYDLSSLVSNDVSVAASSGNSSLLINVGYVKNNGTLVYTDFERYSLRINANTRFFNNRLKIGMNSEVSTSNETGVSNDLGNSPNTGQAITLAPTIPVYRTDGEFAGPLGAGYSDRNNPVGMQHRNRWDDLLKTFVFGNIYVEAEPIKNLFFRSSLGYDFSNSLRKDIEVAFQEGFLGRPVNSLQRNTINQITLTWSNTARYQVQMGKSTFNFLAGVEAIKTNRDDFGAFKEGFANQTQDFFFIDAGSGRHVASGIGGGSRLLSQFGKINYSFGDKYLASVTVRRDGSSRFGKENRYGVFPAVSAGWRIANENFMESVTFISDLKLRAGFGIVGNQDGIDEVASLGLFEPRYGTLFNNGVGFPGRWLNVGTAYDLAGANGGTLPSGFVSVQAPSPSLKWEQTRELNIGVDFSLMDDKLFGSFDYFTREISGILVRPPIAAAIGEGQLRWVNGATKENKGFELVLGYRGQTGGFTYNISGNLARSRDKITDLPVEVYAAFPGNVEKTILGQSDLSLFGYRADGLFQSTEEVAAHATQVGKGIGRIRFKDLNSDGIINALDQDWLGTVLPAFEYGIRIDVGYKNFDLSIFSSGIAGRTGTDPYGSLANRVAVANNNAKGLLAGGWTPLNTSSKTPMLSLVDANAEVRASDFFIVNTSYFKMRTIQLGYTLPAGLLKKARIGSLRVFVMGDNLFWFNPKGLVIKDPELVGLNQIPVPTALSAGLNLTFN